MPAKPKPPRKPPHSVLLDRANLQILAALQKDAKLSFEQLAAAAGLSASPCFSRVKKLEQAGVIRRYGARLDLTRLGPHVTVMTEVTLEKHTSDRDISFRRYINSLPDIVMALQVSGRFDYLLQFVCRDIDRYMSLTQQMVAGGIGIATLASYIVLETAKPFEGYPLRPLFDPR